MSEPVLLLLDVDGVLNALARPLPAHLTWQTGMATAHGRSFEIAWAPEVVARLVALHLSGEVELRWLTTWGHDANTSLRPLLEMPELTVAGTYEDAYDPTSDGDPDGVGSLAAVTPAARDGLTGRWWKFDVVAALLVDEPGRRLVWLDDDLAGEQDLARWTSLQTDALILAPEPRTGLVPADLDTVEAFVRAG